MPILAVGAAAIAIGGAASGIAAAGLTVMTALEVVAAVGATISAIGVVTKDKDLALAGGIIGGIGGIGALAASAGLLGAGASTESLFGPSAAASTADTASSVADTASNTLPDLVGSFDAGTAGAGTAASAGSPFASITTPDIVGSFSSPASFASAAPSLGSTAGTGMINTATPSLGSDATGLNPTSSSVAVNGSSGSSSLSPSSFDISGSVATPSAPGVSVPGSPDVPLTGLDVTHSPINTALPETGDSSGGFLSGILKTPGVGYGVVQAGGAFLQGAFSSLTPAQVAALDAQAAQNRAATTLSLQQQANMNAPLPVASRPVPANVTGAPAGLINQAPPSMVTGRAA